jgi:hypothetical protein
MPFLYLPDAVSLALLVITLTLLRRSAVEHFHQELLKIRSELMLYCCDIGLPVDHPAYLHIQDEISRIGGIAEKISPARLFFAHCLFKRAFTDESSQVLPFTVGNFGKKLSNLENHQIVEKLSRFQLEINLSLGSLYLLGSISGWILSSRLLLKICARMVARSSKKRIDNHLDLGERLISRLGQQTLTLVFSTTKVLDLLPHSHEL